MTSTLAGYACVGTRGEMTDDTFGKSIAMSSDGTILASSVRAKDGNGGQVRVYQLDQDRSGWNHLGQYIDVENALVITWFSLVAMSSDRMIVATGEPTYDCEGGGIPDGFVCFGLTANLVGSISVNPLKAKVKNIGRYVVLSADGTYVASHGNNGNGHVSAYSSNLSGS